MKLCCHYYCLSDVCVCYEMSRCMVGSARITQLKNHSERTRYIHIIIISSFILRQLLPPTMASNNNSHRPAPYTDDELSNALRSFYNNSSSSLSDIDASCAHILGYADPRHTMSMLQRITATIIG